MIGIRLFILLLISLDPFACKEITVSAHPNYPPYHWYDGKKFRGATVESLQKIFKEKSISIKFSYKGPWKRVLLSAKEGDVDLILGLKNSNDRRSYLKFTTEPFFENPFAVFVRKDSPKSYEGIESLKSQRGLFNLGDRYGDDFDLYIKNHLNETRVKSITQAFNLLLEKRFDYYVTGLYTGSFFLLRNQKYQHIKFVKPYVNKGYVYHGFSKKSSCLKYYQFLNEKLLGNRKSGASYDLIEKYKKIWLREN